MPQRLTAVVHAGLAVFALAACEGEQAGQPAGEPVVEEPAAEPTDAPAAGEAGAAVEVDTLEGVGPYLTDADGRALYLLEADTAGQSTCYDRCAEVWPPFLAEGVSPGTGAPPVRSDLLGTIERRDGETQVTYNEHPLYYYARDEGPGQATGQDVHDEWGEWYLVHPEGRELEEQSGG